MAGGGVGGDVGGGRPQRGGKRRSASRSMPEEDPEFQIAPMIDVLLVLMVFFMSITTADIMQNKKGLVLAKAESSNAVIKGNDAIINLEGGGAGGMVIFLGETSISNPTALTAALKPMAETAGKDAKGSSKLIARIRADRNLKYQYVREVLVACSNAGVDKIKYNVVSKDQPAGGQ